MEARKAARCILCATLGGNKLCKPTRYRWKQWKQWKHLKQGLLPVILFVWGSEHCSAHPLAEQHMQLIIQHMLGQQPPSPHSGSDPRRKNIHSLNVCVVCVHVCGHFLGYLLRYNSFCIFISSYVFVIICINILIYTHLCIEKVRCWSWTPWTTSTIESIDYKVLLTFERPRVLLGQKKCLLRSLKAPGTRYVYKSPVETCWNMLKHVETQAGQTETCDSATCPIYTSDFTR